MREGRALRNSATGLRARLIAVLGVLALVVTGFVLGVGPAQAGCPGGADQCSTNNYVGPGPCPFSGAGADCKIVDAGVPITIVQSAPTGGNNQADCRAGT